MGLALFTLTPTLSPQREREQEQEQEHHRQNELAKLSVSASFFNICRFARPAHGSRRELDPHKGRAKEHNKESRRQHASRCL